MNAVDEALLQDRLGMWDPDQVDRPVIVLPQREYSADELENILRHELAHLRRRDIIYKWFAAAVTALHWFNPLVWVAYILFCRDIELACDEKVVKGLDGAARADYSQALLSCAAPGTRRHPPSGSNTPGALSAWTRKPVA